MSASANRGAGQIINRTTHVRKASNGGDKHERGVPSLQRWGMGKGKKRFFQEVRGTKCGPHFGTFSLVSRERPIVPPLD